MFGFVFGKGKRRDANLAEELAVVIVEDNAASVNLIAIRLNLDAT